MVSTNTPCEKWNRTTREDPEHNPKDIYPAIRGMNPSDAHRYVRDASGERTDELLSKTGHSSQLEMAAQRFKYGVKSKLADDIDRTSPSFRGVASGVDEGFNRLAQMVVANAREGHLKNDKRYEKEEHKINVSKGTEKISRTVIKDEK